MKTVKNVLAILVGWVTASMVIYAIEMVGHSQHGFQITPEQLNSGTLPMMPNSVLFWVLSAYVAGSFAGGLVAGLLNRKKKPLCWAARWACYLW